jgi:hypothetical protein
MRKTMRMVITLENVPMIDAHFWEKPKKNPLTTQSPTKPKLKARAILLPAPSMIFKARFSTFLEIFMVWLLTTYTPNMRKLCPNQKTR